MIKLYFWTLSYFKPVLIHTMIYVMLGGITIFGELTIVRRMGFVIDNVLPSNNMDMLFRQMFFLIGITLMVLLSKSFSQYSEKIITAKIVKNQQKDLMNKLQTLGFSYYERVPTGEIISLFENAVKETQKTYTFLFPQFVYCLAQFVVPSFVLLKGEPIFFATAMVGNILYVFLNKKVNKRIQEYMKIESQAAHASQQALYDTIAATKEAKSLGAKDWLISKTMHLFDAYRSSKMHSIFWRHVRFTTVGFTLALSVVLFYIYGFELIQNGDMLIGEFIGYSFLMGLISRGFSVFFYIIPAQLHALNYAGQLYDFMNLRPDVVEFEDSVDSIHGYKEIAFKNVSFSYDGKKEILKNLTFSIPIGKKTALVGESGSGKSTVLKLIGRFYDVTSGEIMFDETNIQKYALKALRKNMGYVFQDTYLFDMTIMENIKFGNPEATDSEVYKAALLAEAHGFIQETEFGYDTMAGDRGLRFSGGQKQRISLARMLLKNPEIILLDEATSALDNKTESLIKKSLDRLSHDKTLVTVAHKLSTVMDYDNIIVLDAGEIVEQGTYETLMLNKSFFYNLVMRGADGDV